MSSPSSALCPGGMVAEAIKSAVIGDVQEPYGATFCSGIVLLLACDCGRMANYAACDCRSRAARSANPADCGRLVHVPTSNCASLHRHSGPLMGSIPARGLCAVLLCAV